MTLLIWMNLNWSIKFSNSPHFTESLLSDVSKKEKKNCTNFSKPLNTETFAKLLMSHLQSFFLHPIFKNVT